MEKVFAIVSPASPFTGKARAGWRDYPCYAALPPAFDLKKFGSIELKQSIVIVVSPHPRQRGSSTAAIGDQT